MTSTLLATAASLTACSQLSSPLRPPPCTATAGTGTMTLQTDQALNASTIAAVGKRLGVPDHGITIALATALQESKLRDLPGGDRDSVGLFQQRPSQGWGPASSLLDPRFAATAFYQHLLKVDGWQTMSVTGAAQQVQHSASGTAYAGWEADSRVLAQALTGEVPAGLACRVGQPGTQPGLAAALDAEIGPGAVGGPVTPAQGWLTASWLVAHAGAYPISTVRFGEWQWTAATGRWTAGNAATSLVTITPALSR